MVRPLTADALVAEVNAVLGEPGYREAAQWAGQSIAKVADPVRVCREALDVAG